MTDALPALIFAFSLSVGMLVIALKWGYFELPQKLSSQQEDALSLKDCCQLFLLFLAFFATAPLFLYWQFAEDLKKKDMEFLGWINLGFVASAAVILFAFSLLKWNKVKTLFKTSHFFKDIALGISSWFIAFPFAMAFSSLIVYVLTVHFGYELDEQVAVIQFKNSLAYPTLFKISLIAVVFIIPILEELIFRGFLQTALAYSFSPLISVILSAALFSLFHFSKSQGMNNLNILCALFVLALFLGFLRLRQNNIWSSVALHATFNAVSIGMILKNILMN